MAIFDAYNRTAVLGSLKATRYARTLFALDMLLEQLDMQPYGCSIASFSTCIKVVRFFKTPSNYFTTLISVILSESVRISKVRCGLF